MSNLIKVINAAWEQRSELAPTSVDAEIVEAIEHCIDGLDSGELRVAEPKEGNWVVNDWLKKAEAKVPFKRLNKPLDVAKILAFLCSEESGIMTGSIVDFDQTVAGWHSYSAYDTKILDDSLLGE